MSATGSMNPRPMSGSAESGRKVLRGKGAEERWDDETTRDDEDEEDDPDAERQAEHERRTEQADAAAEHGDEPQADAAALDPQLERAEGEGMVTEHAKVSATDPGPEPLPEEPEPEEPEPDRGPGAPQWEADEERD